MGLFDNITTSNPQYDIIRNMTKDIHIHDYQLPVLYGYRNIPKKMKEFSHDDKSFTINKECFFINDSVTCEEIYDKLREGYAVNSLVKYQGASKRCEIVYDMDQLFDRTNYDNGKKYHKRIVRPLNFVERNDITIRLLTKDDLEIAYTLYDKWVEHKLADDKLFKIMFPKARYKNCLDYAVQKQLPELYAFGCFRNGELLAFRVVSISNGYSYGLAYIVDRDQDFCANLSEILSIAILNKLKNDYGVKIFNCGLAEGSLKKFKQHLPSIEYIFYRYTKSALK